MDVHVARQPILDRRSQVVGYEMLFRDGVSDSCNAIDGFRASASVITNTLFLPCLDFLRSGRDAFFNVSAELILNGCLYALPTRHCVFEILETVEATREVLEACQMLGAHGYRIALDDFAFEPTRTPFLQVADYVKVDVQATDPARCAALAREMIRPETLLLAEKVETHDSLRQLLDLGYDLFQGYYFARPTIVTGRKIPTSQLAYLQVLQEINRPEIDSHALREIVEREAGLSYMLLKHVNAACFGWREPVHSIQHAILVLGETDIRRWATLIALAGTSKDQPVELIVLALLRARFCELLAEPARQEDRSDDLFLVGLFSLMDTVLNCSKEDALANLPVDPDVKAAILDRSGPLGGILDLAISYTEANWGRSSALAEAQGIPEEVIPQIYETSLDFCTSKFGPLIMDAAA